MLNFIHMYQVKVSKEINFMHDDNAISYLGRMFQVCKHLPCTVAFTVIFSLAKYGPTSYIGVVKH